MHRRLSLLAAGLVGCIASSEAQPFEDLEVDTSGDLPVFSWDSEDAVLIEVTGSDEVDSLTCSADGVSGTLYYYAYCPDSIGDAVRESEDHNCLRSPWTYGDPAPDTDPDDRDYFYARALDKAHPKYCLEITSWGDGDDPGYHSVITFEI